MGGRSPGLWMGGRSQGLRIDGWKESGSEERQEESGSEDGRVGGFRALGWAGVGVCGWAGGVGA